MDEFDPAVPFLRRDALAAGISPKQLRGPSFRVVLPGVYVAASTPVTPLLRVRAALVPYGASAWASHASAARVYDLPLPTIPEEHLSVTRAGRRRRHAGVRVHVAGEGRTRTVHGVRVCEPTRLFVELASLIPLVDLVVVGDAMVRRRLLTPEDLVSSCAASRHPAASAARRAAGYVRRDVDSPMETRLRMLIVLAGLPEPRINLTLRTDDGSLLRRYDLSYPEALVVIEYDGRHHAERVESWEADLQRREAIDDEGWRILVVVASGIYRDPAATLARVHRLLRARGMAGVPTRLSEEWRAHFPGRAQAA